MADDEQFIKLMVGRYSAGNGEGRVSSWLPKPRSGAGNRAQEPRATRAYRRRHEALAAVVARKSRRTNARGLRRRPQPLAATNTCTMAEPPNLMPPRSARLPLVTNTQGRTLNYSVPSGTPQGRTRKSIFLPSGSQMRE